MILRNALDDPAPTGSPSAPAPDDTLPLPQQPDVLVTSALYRSNQLVAPDGLTDRVVDLDSLYPTPPTGNTRKRKARPPNGDVGRDLFRRPAVVRKLEQVPEFGQTEGAAPGRLGKKNRSE